jgi:hypothetical protein
MTMILLNNVLLSALATWKSFPLKVSWLRVSRRGRYSIVGIATRYGLDGRGLYPGGDEIFCTRPHRPRGPPILLYNGYRSFLGVKRPGRGFEHPTPPSTEVEGRVDLSIWAFEACSRVNFTFTLPVEVLGSACLLCFISS